MMITIIGAKGRSIELGPQRVQGTILLALQLIVLVNVENVALFYRAFFLITLLALTPHIGFVSVHPTLHLSSTS